MEQFCFYHNIRINLFNLNKSEKKLKTPFQKIQKLKIFIEHIVLLVNFFLQFTSFSYIYLSKYRSICYKSFTKITKTQYPTDYNFFFSCLPINMASKVCIKVCSINYKRSSSSGLLNTLSLYKYNTYIHLSVDLPAIICISICIQSELSEALRPRFLALQSPRQGSQGAGQGLPGAGQGPLGSEFSEDGYNVTVETLSTPEMTGLRNISWPRSPTRAFIRNFPQEGRFTGCIGCTGVQGSMQGVQGYRGVYTGCTGGGVRMIYRVFSCL